MSSISCQVDRPVRGGIHVVCCLKVLCQSIVEWIVIRAGVNGGEMARLLLRSCLRVSACVLKLMQALLPPWSQSALLPKPLGLMLVAHSCSQS